MSFFSVKQPLYKSKQLSLALGMLSLVAMLSLLYLYISTPIFSMYLRHMGIVGSSGELWFEPFTPLVLTSPFWLPLVVLTRFSEIFFKNAYRLQTDTLPEQVYNKNISQEQTAIVELQDKLTSLKDQAFLKDIDYYINQAKTPAFENLSGDPVKIVEPYDKLQVLIWAHRKLAKVVVAQATDREQLEAKILSKAKDLFKHLLVTKADREQQEAQIRKTNLEARAAQDKYEKTKNKASSLQYT